jgi:hypothetical protein
MVPAIQRALRSLEDFHAFDVIDVHVDRAVDRRHRLLIEIGTDTWLRAGVIAVLAAHYATHVDVGRTDTIAALAETFDARDARQELDVVVDILDVQLLELLGAERLDADGHILQVLGLLLRRDDHLFERGALGISSVGGCGGRARENRRDGRGDRQPL